MLPPTAPPTSPLTVPPASTFTWLGDLLRTMSEAAPKLNVTLSAPLTWKLSQLITVRGAPRLTFRLLAVGAVMTGFVPPALAVVGDAAGIEGRVCASAARTKNRVAPHRAVVASRRRSDPPGALTVPVVMGVAIVPAQRAITS